MYPQTPCGYTGPMSYGHGVSSPGDGMDNFYEMQHQWSGMDAVCSKAKPCTVLARGQYPTNHTLALVPLWWSQPPLHLGGSFPALGHLDPNQPPRQLVCPPATQPSSQSPFPRIPVRHGRARAPPSRVRNHGTLPQ